MRSGLDVLGESDDGDGEGESLFWRWPGLLLCVAAIGAGLYYLAPVILTPSGGPRRATPLPQPRVQIPAPAGRLPPKKTAKWFPGWRYS